MESERSENRTKGSRKRFALLIRIFLVSAALLTLVIAAASISIAPETRGKLLDDKGDPIEGAYIVYYYRGYRFNLVDSITYWRPGSIIRTDSTGSYKIERLLHFHNVLDRKLFPWIEFVYIPKLHHAFGPLVPGKTSFPGRVAFNEIKQATVFSDFSDNPYEWSRSINELDAMIRQLNYDAEEKGRYQVPVSVRQDLMDHFLTEYEEFMQRYADTPRELGPFSAYFFALSLEERERTLKRMEEALEREPLWGQVMERKWSRDLKALKHTTSPVRDQPPGGK